MHHARDGGDHDGNRVAPRIHRRGDQSHADGEKKRAAVHHEMHIVWSRLGHSRHELEKPGRRKEEHLESVDEVENGENPENWNDPFGRLRFHSVPLPGLCRNGVGRTCEKIDIESETVAATTARSSKILAVLMTLKNHSAKPIGIAPITDSVSVTPIVTAKLIARSFIGHDIANSSSARQIAA